MTTAQTATAKANPFNSTAGGLVAPGVSQPVAGSAHTPHGALVAVGGEVIFVIIATVIANTGPKAATAMVALFVVLWLLFLINHYSGG